MNWHTLISECYKSRKSRTDLESKPAFRSPATGAEIEGIESEFQVTTPPELRSILLETNGVMELLKVQDEWIETGWLLWPAEEIVRWNRSYRRDRDVWYQGQFLDLFIFSSPGVDGNLFVNPIDENRTASPAVLCWYADQTPLTELASSLEDFLKGWISGAIGI